MSGSGYVAPLPDGGHVVGATYQHDDAGEDVRAADHARESRPGGGDASRASRTASIRPPSPGSPDFARRCPTGCPSSARPALPGVWAATGLGSRGLLWGPIGAELIASRLEGEPSPLPRDLAGAISPRRFLS